LPKVLQIGSGVLKVWTVERSSLVFGDPVCDKHVSCAWSHCRR